MSWYRSPSMYSLKMQRLGAKIFNEYRPPKMPKEVATASNKQVQKDFWYKVRSTYNIINWQMQKPDDININFNPEWYPAHPQIRQLTHILRQHGLFRDEHRDFTEEMKRLRILRGKVYRVRGGKSGKRAKLREGNS